MSDVLLGALTIFCLRICDVSVGTMRVMFLVNGRRLPATCLAFFESLIWILAISQVLKHVDSWPNILGYAGGFATGTLVGMSVEQFLAFGQVLVRAVTRNPDSMMQELLAAEGYGVTSFSGEGIGGKVEELVVVAPRRRQRHLLKLLHQIDPKCFITVEPISHRVGGFHARGMAR